MTHRRLGAMALCAGAALAASSRADLLFSNGPFVTDPTGGTGAILGQAISQADPFTIPGSTFIFSTLGINAAHGIDVAVADNFVVPAGPGWILEAVTLFAFQTSQAAPAVHTIRINLWDAAPYSANSPPPVPNPLPQPLLSQPLVLAAGPGTFVAHRQSANSTGTERPVFAYTVPLSGLPNGGRLEPGEYWLEWSFEGALSPSINVFTPLVSPRGLAFDHNARLWNSLDGTPTGPRSWFEGREGFVAGQTEGRAYALPFELHGSVVPAPGGAVVVGAGFVVWGRRGRRKAQGRRQKA